MAAAGSAEASGTYEIIITSVAIAASLVQVAADLADVAGTYKIIVASVACAALLPCAAAWDDASVIGARKPVVAGVS